MEQDRGAQVGATKEGTMLAQRQRSFWWWGVAVILAVAPTPSAAQAAGPRAGQGTDGALWDKTVRPLLALDLWADATAYDAAHFLMVPLHAAFALHDARWQSQFAAHFARFAVSGFQGRGAAGREPRLQYLYLASEFAVLAADARRGDLIPQDLLDRIYAGVAQNWQEDTVRGWPRSGIIRDRLAWKLSVRNPPHSYYRVIDDAERFLFGIAADLRAYELASGVTDRRSPVVTEILAAARSAFEQRGVAQVDGGWLFQPGVWSDHPDYAFAGQPAKVEGMSRSPVPDIAEDASHSLRMPLLLTSLMNAYGPGDSARAFYERARVGLARQFLAHVLVPPSAALPGYRITNYLDGRNGVYRWGYRNRGPDWGYGPYELSGSLTLGWWAFLGDSAVASAYHDIAVSFPLAPAVLALYARGTPHRDSRDPRYIIRDSWANGFKWLIVRLAARLPQ
jgi:hypothetical protein